MGIGIKNNLKLVSFFLCTFCLLTFSGCATTSTKSAKDQVIFSQTVKIGRTQYVPVTILCKAYQLRWDWDIIGKKATLTDGETIMKLVLDCPVVVINGRSKRLSDNIKVYNGLIMVPVSAKRSIFDTTFRKTPVRRKFKKASSQPSLVKTIVIDPGHGGRDPGAIGRSGLKEKDITLSIAKRLAQELRKRGINVVLTRDSDKFVSLWKRSQIANSHKASFFISIHANSARARKAEGLEVYYLSDATDDTARALAAAENASLDLEKSSFDAEKPSTDLEATLWDMLYTENRIESKELASEICQGIDSKLYLHNRGVKSARFYVLKGTRMPSVLIEVGFISNQKEEIRLKSAYYHQQLAESISKGILSYAQKYERTAGFSR